jgi:predicted HNH restriction endonuclease
VALRETAIQRALRQHGRSFCVVCGFDFKVTYGALGDGYIGCHHTKPISELTPGARIDVADVAMLCANCHRMIHRRRPWLTLPDLAELLAGRGG